MSETKMSAIEMALAAAKARKAAKEAAGALEESPQQTQPRSKAPGLSPAERAEKQAQLAAERAERKARREQEKAQRDATRAATRSTGSAHMKKVESARSKLQPLSSEAELAYNEIIGNFSGPVVATIAEHLKLYVRLSATQRAASGAAIPVGTTVRITGGDSKHLNEVGVVTKSQKLRSYVKVEGLRKDVYVFTSDLTVVEEQSTAVAV